MGRGGEGNDKAVMGVFQAVRAGCRHHGCECYARPCNRKPVQVLRCGLCEGLYSLSSCSRPILHQPQALSFTPRSPMFVCLFKTASSVRACALPHGLFDGVDSHTVQGLMSASGCVHANEGHPLLTFDFHNGGFVSCLRCLDTGCAVVYRPNFK
jgi:hypothetical protein